MERGEIWLVSLDPTTGHEQQGTRPVLIVTPAAFNRVTRLPVVVPVTSGGNFACTAGFAGWCRHTYHRCCALRSTPDNRYESPRRQTTRTGSGDHHERSSWPPVHYSDLNMGF